MLVRFNSSTSGEMLIFAEHLRPLFEIIGKECTARGVFVCEQLPDALASLHQAVEAERHALHEAERKAHEAGLDETDEAEDEAAKEECKAGRRGVTLCQRATPLIHLMEWTLREKGFILWETDRDF